MTQWTSANNMILNVKKTKEFTVSFMKNQPQLPPLNDLKWCKHVERICSKASKRLYVLRTLKRSGVPTSDPHSVHSYFMRPVLGYVCPVPGTRH